MKLGFIGAGNMAGAIIKGITGKEGGIPGNNVFVFDISKDALAALEKKHGIIPCSSAEEAAEGADILIFAVKPNVLPSVASGLKETLNKNGTLVISIAVGRTLEYLESLLGDGQPIVRVMPNINAKVGAAISGYCANRTATCEHKKAAEKIFSAVGRVLEIPENQFSAFGVIAGSSPAFAYLYIDALARAAQKAGMPKKQALEIAAQTVFGSAKMILESDEHPWSLIDQVCSPGGTTIEGIYSLEDNRFESTVFKAFDAVLAKDLKIQGK